MQGALLHLHLHLREAEVQGPRLEALFPDPLGEVQKKAQVLGQEGVLLGEAKPFGEGLHLGVGEAGHAPYDSLGEADPFDLQVLVQVHQNREDQAVLPWPQGADPVGEPLGEHGEDPARQVDAGAPQEGLLV